ncbi:MAG: hypothetical protein IKW45_09310, partial [Clostridia bacterium]|nr:hypothetical protein [Clostridia bacterium]
GTSTTPDTGTSTTPDTGTSTTPDTGTSTTPDTGTSTTPDAGTSTGATKADVAKAINDATATAAKASYTWTRSSYYTKPIDVTAKDTLNKIIGMVDSSGTATVESVVGGFLDITGEGNSMTANVANGQLPAEGMNGKDKFLLIASKLTEGDVANFKVDGNKYMVLLPNCTKPQKDGSNALSRVTNDFITCDEVNEGLVGAGAGSLIKANDVNVTYKDIIITAEIVDGKLTKYDITYTMDVASMDLKALGMVSVGGSGAGKLECTYSDFKY